MLTASMFYFCATLVYVQTVELLLGKYDTRKNILHETTYTPMPICNPSPSVNDMCRNARFLWSFVRTLYKHTS